LDYRNLFIVATSQHRAGLRSDTGEGQTENKLRKGEWVKFGQRRWQELDATFDLQAGARGGRADLKSQKARMKNDQRTGKIMGLNRE